jgi:hypothetical protein
MVEGPLAPRLRAAYFADRARLAGDVGDVVSGPADSRIELAVAVLMNVHRYSAHQALVTLNALAAESGIDVCDVAGAIALTATAETANARIPAADVPGLIS